VTDWDLFGATAGPATTTVDGTNPYTLGVEWSVSTAGRWLKGYRMWRPPDLGVVGPCTARTWEAVSESPVANTDAAFVLSGGGWQEVLLATPQPVVAGTRYRVGVHFPGGRYSFTATYWGASVVNGALVGHSQATATNAEQGSLLGGAVLAFPGNGSPNAANYWITPIITDVDPSADFRQGAVSFSLPMGLDTSGDKAGAGAVSTVLGAVGLDTAGGKAAAGSVGMSFPLGVSVVGSDSDHSQAAVSAVLCSPWATPADIPQSIKDEMGLTDAQLLDPLVRASEMLWALSGRRWYGAGCTEEARLVPAMTVDHHESWGLCGCWDLAPGTPFGHMDQPRSVRLARRAGTITSVTVDGEVLAPTAYRLSRSGWLERIDGGLWNVCAGETVIVYTFGQPPPSGGRAAAVQLAIELARDFHNLKGCRLPQRTTSVTRQGVTIDIADPMEFLKDGGVGIVSVDTWIKSVNPGNRAQAGTVWSPDLPAARHRKAVL